MKKKLNLILLVDDDSDCNYFHKLLFKKIGCCENVHVVLDGSEALDFISTKVNGKYPCPDIIFLDINMPKMNGWEFLEKYKDLDQPQKAKIVLIMLTTSLNEDDKERAVSNKDVNGFKNKYLTEQSLKEIFLTYFPEYS